MRTQQANTNAFAATPFYQQIARSYQQGAEWLFCADMEQIVAQHVQAGSNLPPGIGDVRYLTMEHREVGGKTESHADLMFASERQGVASWLAAPASMGSLEFVSPDASMVTSAVIKNPRSIMEEMFKMIGSGDAEFARASGRVRGQDRRERAERHRGAPGRRSYDGVRRADAAHAAVEADFRSLRSGDPAVDDREAGGEFQSRRRTTEGQRDAVDATAGWVANLLRDQQSESSQLSRLTTRLSTTI